MTRQPTNAVHSEGAPASKRSIPRTWYVLHGSTFVASVLAATVLFFLNVPGQYVPYVGMPLDSGPISDFVRPVRERLEHGWPLTYLIRNDQFFVDRPGETGYRSTAIWSFTEDFVSFNGWSLAADIAAALCIMMFAAFVAEYWRKQRQTIWQLRMSDMFMVTAVIAAAIWFSLSTLREYERELVTMRKLGLQVDEDNQRYRYPDFSLRTRGGPSWLRVAIGEERFPRVFDRLVFAEVPEFNIELLKGFRHLKAISLIEPPGRVLQDLTQLQELQAIQLHVDTLYWPDKKGNELDLELARQLSELTTMPGLRLLAAIGNGVGDHTTGVIAEFPRLRVVNLSRSSITDAGLAALAKCEHLEELYLQDTAITDASLDHLSPMPQLRVLDLFECSVSDAALDHLSQFSGLHRLNLDGTQIRGRSLRELARLRSLQTLSLPLRIDRSAVHELQRQLPGLKIEIGDEQFLGTPE